jgi:hypothetical protein
VSVVTTTLVHAMLDRARTFTSSDLHDEKMLSLESMSAGLALRVNTRPASAAVRGAANLEEAVKELGDAARAGVRPHSRKRGRRARQHSCGLPRLKTSRHFSPSTAPNREDAIAVGSTRLAATHLAPRTSRSGPDAASVWRTSPIRSNARSWTRRPVARRRLHDASIDRECTDRRRESTSW